MADLVDEGGEEEEKDDSTDDDSTDDEEREDDSDEDNSDEDDSDEDDSDEDESDEDEDEDDDSEVKVVANTTNITGTFRMERGGDDVISDLCVKLEDLRRRQQRLREDILEIIKQCTEWERRSDELVSARRSRVDDTPLLQQMNRETLQQLLRESLDANTEEDGTEEDGTEEDSTEEDASVEQDGGRRSAQPCTIQPSLIVMPLSDTEELIMAVDVGITRLHGLFNAKFLVRCRRGCFKSMIEREPDLYPPELITYAT